MPSNASKALSYLQSQTFARTYIVYIAFCTTCVVIFRALHPDGYVPGDWLINYQAGFVRRGLLGEFLLHIARFIHVRPFVVGAVFPLAMYGLFYVLFWKLYERAEGSFWQTIALMSPATLAFPVLAGVGASRKETVLLLLLATLISSFSKQKNLATVRLSITLTAGVSILLLSHEGLAPYLVYCFGALLIGFDGELKPLFEVLLLPIIAAIPIELAVLSHPGTLSQAQVICGSLGSAPPIICSGAIAYLAKTKSEAHADTVFAIRHFKYAVYYPILVVTSLVPLGGLARSLLLKNRRDMQIVLAISLVAVLATIPLFYYGLDWGRWIYIHVVCVYLLLLFVSGRSYTNSDHDMQKTPGWLADWPKSSMALIVVYVICWNIPYAQYQGLHKGYFNLPLHYLKMRFNRH